MRASTVKLLCFTVGIFLLWLTLLVIATNFYAGLVGVVVAAVEGGEYRALLFENTTLMILAALAGLGAFVIAIGLVEKEDKAPTTT